MPNLSSLLKAEIIRISRKEIKASVKPVKDSNADLKKNIAELKKRIAALESQIKKFQSLLPAQEKANVSPSRENQLFIQKHQSPAHQTGNLTG